MRAGFLPSSDHREWQNSIVIGHSGKPLGCRRIPSNRQLRGSIFFLKGELSGRGAYRCDADLALEARSDTGARGRPVAQDVRKSPARRRATTWTMGRRPRPPEAVTLFVTAIARLFRGLDAIDSIDNGPEFIAALLQGRGLRFVSASVRKPSIVICPFVNSIVDPKHI